MNYAWTFDNGKAAEVCAEDGLFFTADTSDLGQPFSDAFVTFHISRDGFKGSNVVPYLPPETDEFCTKGKAYKKAVIICNKF